jgi:O-acetyl-ADP-ribose deacetylase (regulator of RNase III)
MVEKKIGEKVVRVVLGDITDIEVEAFVFDITEDAKLGSGYGGAITLRGGPEVQKELDAIGACPSGEAIVTGAGNMKAKTIIHLNGPKFHEPGTEEILRRAVKAALQLAEEKAVTQLAFPPVGTGMYQVPLDLCARVLDEEISGHFAGETTLKEVLLVALDTREYEPLRAQIGTGG